MSSTVLPDTYVYKDFISEEERISIFEWAKQAYVDNKLVKNEGSNRFFNTFSSIKNIPSLILDIKEKIIRRERLNNSRLDPWYGDFLSFNFSGAAIHLHTDPNLDKCTHTRYNLIINKPESGGDILYNGSIIPVEEKMLWRCEAGRYLHGSSAVVGSKPRVNISFGFQIDN